MGRHKITTEESRLKSIMRAAAVSNVAMVSSRGQLTIPLAIREISKIGEGSIVSLEPQKEGILLRPMRVEAESPYTDEEWTRIEKLCKEEGFIFDSARKAKKYLKAL